MTTTPYGWNVCVRSESPAWQSQQALELLQPDRWMNWHYLPFVNAPGYVPTLYSYPAPEAAIMARLLAHPDETWLFLNEPHLLEQANMTPKEGVDAAFWLLNLAHANDVAINWCGPNCAINMHDGGSMSGQEWWREWLRQLRQAGIVRPSFHGVHLYHSTNRAMMNATWSDLLTNWRWQWMGDGPVVITEMCAENQSYAIQCEVMDAAFALYQQGRTDGPAGERGVMGVYWFVATHKPSGSGAWPNCVLCEPDPDRVQTMRLTPLGKRWKALQAKLAR